MVDRGDTYGYSQVIGNELLAALDVEASDLGAALPIEEQAALGGALRRLAILVSHRARADTAEEVLDAERDIVEAVERALCLHGAVGVVVVSRAAARVGEAAATVLRRVARRLLAEFVQI